MGKKKKKAKCIVCGKILIDKNKPICNRCAVTFQEKAKETGEVLLVGGAAVAGVVSKVIESNKSNDEEKKS